MKMYVEVDNRLIKDNNQKNKIIKETKITDQTKTKDILESYGLSKDARVLTE